MFGVPRLPPRCFGRPAPGAREPDDDTVTLPAIAHRPGAAGAASEPLADSSSALPRGSRLGRYRILHGLGCGGSANVYAAYDPELDRTVALKVLRNRPGRSRLLHEAQAAARLNHPNVVTVFDLGLVGEQLFVAMERVEGVTLGEWLDQRRTWRQTVAVLAAAGEGLAAAHAAGVIHGDLKPSNVMVADDGRVLVLDFGLAREAAAGAGARDRRPPPAGGPPGGTPAYMAPEQRLGAAADTRSDQYGFAVTLHRALYGVLPGPGTPRPPSRPRLPSAVRRVVTRGLAADPEDRFESMEALVRALTRAAGASRRRARWSAAAAVGLLATAIGSWSASPDRLCTGGPERLAGVWDDATRARAREAFAASGHPRADDLWRRTRSLLDAHARRWIELHRSACVATRIRREQSEQALDLQMACLDARRQELASVARVLAQADRELVDRGIAIAERLPPLERCANHALLAAEPAPPADPTTAAAVRAVQTRLAESKAFESAGRYTASIEAAGDALDRARALGYPPAEADALIQLAAAHGRTGLFGEMREMLIAAATIAQTAGYDHAVGTAFTYLIVAAAHQGDLAEAHRWAGLSGGALERIADRDGLAALRELFLGELARLEGRHADAIEHHESYLRLGTHLGGVQRAYAYLHLARQHAALGQVDAARRELERALELFHRSLGDGHRAIAQTRLVLGDVELRRGDSRAALAHYRTALRILDADGDPDDFDTAAVLEGAGRSLLELDRAGEAVAPLERALAARRARPTGPADLAESRFLLARALWRTGEPALAREQALAARELFAASEPPAGETADVDDWLSRRGWG